MENRIEDILSKTAKDNLRTAEEFRNRLLNYPNPVEFVNNMYGCHPDDIGGDYFSTIYSKK